MTILKSVINVNNGNTGWTKANVLDALETAFANLGFHGGTPITGSPVALLSPVFQTPNIGDSGWNNVGGVQPQRRNNYSRYFYVTPVGTAAYSILEEWRISNSYVNLIDNTIQIALSGYVPHYVQTGDAIRYAPGSTDTNLNFGSEILIDTVYYAIRENDFTIKLAATLSDANNNIPIDITTVPTGNLVFRREASAEWENPTIDIDLGDTVYFTVDDSTSGGDFYFIDTRVNSYSSERILNTSNFDNISYREFPSGMGIRDANNIQSITWTARGWQQSETENSNPQDILPEAGFDGTYSYGYANSTNPSMKGTINLVTRYATNNDYSSFYPYYKYTVPASGGRSELKLRIYRQPRQNTSSNQIAGLSIHSIGSGWSNDEVFTIPGSATGGDAVNTTNDIKFGVNAAETSSSANDGIANIKVTNYGAGTSFWQKNSNGYFAVLKNVNDESKTFGSTYYTFGMASGNSYRMYIQSGCIWGTLNRLGTNSGNPSGNYEYGFFGGNPGLDYQTSFNYIGDSSSFTYVDYASTSTPTAYPLSIRTYRAQSPQDTNYAIIQFTQTINGVTVPFATFSINRGLNYGNGVWDTNNVWNGGITKYGTSTRGVDIIYSTLGYTSYGSQPQDEPADSQSLARMAEYGYLRNPGSFASRESRTMYTCNIDTDSDTYNSTHAITYYRNSTFDSEPRPENICFADRNRSVSSAANYYKPIKGIPLANNLVPCPYYIPDDFVMLQVATSPGLTEFRIGDTVTISQSEVYEIIMASYQTNQNGLDNINNNSSIGMLFCARVI